MKPIPLLDYLGSPIFVFLFALLFFFAMEIPVAPPAFFRAAAAGAQLRLLAPGVHASASYSHSDSAGDLDLG